MIEDNVSDENEILEQKIMDSEKEAELNLSPGTINMIRYLFMKGFYYDDSEAMIKTAEILIKFSKNQIELKKRIDELRNMISEIELVERNHQKIQ